MKQQIFEIELKQPVIISQQSATVGAHQCLDYIAGSTLLGLVATKLYNDISPQEAFQVFHSGHVRFLDALPVDQDEISYPVPLSLHVFKGEKYSQGQNLISDQIFDISKKDQSFFVSRQPVQLRNFYLTESGRKFIPYKEQTLKTAIDAKQNRAAEAQLFGYEALSKGQKFRFSVQANDVINEALWKKVITSLQGQAHLGRSRSAQFGRVNIQPVKEIYQPQMQLKGNILTLWLLSDLCLHHQGQNTLIPSPEVLALPHGTTWLKEKSFIRSRRYSMYNAYRKHYDKERQVLTRGSVLTYKLPENFSDFKALEDKLSRGVGLYTEMGLGQVSINPHVLQQDTPMWTVGKKERVFVTKKALSNPNTLLISVLQARYDVEQLGTSPRYFAEQIFSKLCEKISYARRYHAIPKGTAFELGEIPSRTQFGRFKELANQYRNDTASLWNELTNSTNGMLNIETEQESTNRQSAQQYNRGGWELKFGLSAQDTLGDALKNELSQHRTLPYFPKIVAELAMLGLSDQWEKCCLGMSQEQEGVSA